MFVNADQDYSSGARITALPAAIAAGQPVIFEQLNAAVAGLAPKDSVRVSTQGNINLAAPGAAVDGITMALNDRFVARFQTAGAENGGYVWNGAGVPAVRSYDMQSADNLEAAVVTVEEGTSAGRTFRQTSVNFVLGTGVVAWVPFGDAVGAASKTSTGIVRLATAAETVTGIDETIAVTPAGLAAYTGFTKKYARLIGDGSAGTFVVTHNLNTRDVDVVVRRNVAPFDKVLVDDAATTVNTVTLTFSGLVPTADQFRVSVLG